ncbi:hypothetical protein [Enterovirga rhinocerotis]|uniref:Phage tail lysozyme domain-containing protein n=1 Tax=Enterovirga rhinocerotis TaxID=1339210 RepID=A0A4R7CA15_9HYPH|nr:hypothetical protein [Enterovirga rhinocerotis]TDR93806.1 hypothetical protein EV668_1073 [Enterovirga rhinocerotis]
MSAGSLAELGRGCAGLLGNLISPAFGTPKQVDLPSLLPTSTMTVTAATVIINSVTGPQSLMGGAGSILGTNPASGQSMQGAGSGILGFGLAGAQSQGAQQAGSGLLSFGFGANGMRTPGGGGGDIMGRFLSTAQSGGLTNPYALATLAAYGKHESGWSARNIGGSWSDPSQSGAPGTSGGLLSWRNERLSAMRSFTAGDTDPVSAQARFFLRENPSLIRQLQGAGSLEEANRLMANAWKFQGYNSAGGEFGARLGTSRSYLDQIGGGHGGRSLLERRSDAGSIDFDGAAKSFAQSTDQASQSLTSLADATAQLPAGADAAASSLTNLLGSLFSGKGGGGGILASLFGGGGGETVTAAMADGGLLRGPGGPRSDSLLIRASAGEYVVNARSTSQHRGLLDAINYGGAYADGGYVTPLPVEMPPMLATAPAPAPSAANNNTAPIHYAPTYHIPPLANGVTPQDVVRAIEDYDRRLDRQLPGRVANAQKRFG